MKILGYLLVGLMIVVTVLEICGATRDAFDPKGKNPPKTKAEKIAVALGGLATVAFLWWLFLS